MFEKIILNEMFNFLYQNNLISPKQTGFKPEDSCIDELISIAHKIYQSLDATLEVSSVFLNKPKSFDKAWQERVVFKLSQNVILTNF